MIKSAGLINYASLLLMAILWGSVFATIIMALDSFEPMAVAWWRTAIAAVFLWVCMLVLKKPLSKDAYIWRQMAIISVLLIVLPYSFITYAGLYTNSSIMGLAMATMPLFALILSHYFNMIEHVYWYNYAGIAIGFMGMYLLFFGDGESIDIENATGGILAVGAGICYAIASVLNKRLAGTVDLENQITMPFITGTVLLLPIIGVMGTDLFPASPSQDAVLALVYTGLFPTAIAGIIRIFVLLRTNPAFASLTTYMIPIVSTLIGVIFMGDILQKNFWTAIVLVMVGIILCQYRPKSKNVFS